MYRDGWYYLLGTHGTCCDGANSTYNIRVGRSRRPTGPYVDNEGIPLLKGGGKLVVAASGRHMGPGHFGLLDLGDGVQKFSCHYEADLDRSGRSILDIRPLLWKDGWPVGGDNFQEGTYEIMSERSGFGLQLDVDFVRMDNGRRGARWRWPWHAVGQVLPGGAPRLCRRCGVRQEEMVAPAGGGGGGFNRAPAGPAVAGSESGAVAGSGSLAYRHGRREPYRLHGSPQSEMEDHARRRRWRLSRIALLQDPNRRHGAHLGGSRGWFSGRASCIYQRS